MNIETLRAFVGTDYIFKTKTSNNNELWLNFKLLRLKMYGVIIADHLDNELYVNYSEFSYYYYSKDIAKIIESPLFKLIGNPEDD